MDLSIAQGLEKTTEEISCDSDLKSWLHHGVKSIIHAVEPSNTGQVHHKTQTQVGFTGPGTSGGEPFAQTQPNCQIQPTNLASLAAPQQPTVHIGPVSAAPQLNPGLSIAQKEQVTPAVPALREDPKCRFIFLYAGSSRSPLRLSHEMLARILTHHQVMAGFIDFASVFGTQAESRGQRFCGFKTRSQLTRLPSLAAGGLGRSGRFYQICYNLRAAGCGTNDIWSIKQTVFHHQFDVDHGTALWISAKGDREMSSLVDSAAKRMDKDRFEDVGRCFASTLEIHLIHFQWCTKGWLRYIESMEKLLEKSDGMISAVMQGSEGNRLTVHHLVKVQKLENDSNEVLTTLEANINILSSLQGFYCHIVKSNTDMPAARSGKDVSTFVKRLQDLESDIRRDVTRAERLVRLTADMKNLVIKQLEFQSTREMEDLTISTYALGEFAQREAVAVRIITVVSLVYLPCSVVSSIFSTDIVKFQSSEPSPAGTSFSALALQRWLEVTLPLTFLTLFLGYWGYRFEKHRQHEEIESQKRLQLIKLGR